jgi:hypothetical protein
MSPETVRFARSETGTRPESADASVTRGAVDRTNDVPGVGPAD